MDGGLKHVLTHLSLTLTSCPLRSWSSGTSVAMQRVPGQVPVIVGWLLFSHDNPWFHSTESHFLKLFFFPASGAVLTSTSLPSGLPSSFSLLLFWLSVMARVIQILISWYRHWYPLESALVATDTSLLACSGSSVSAQASRLFPRLCRRARSAPSPGLSQGTLWRFYSSLHVFLKDYIKLLWIDTLLSVWLLAESWTLATLDITLWTSSVTFNESDFTHYLEKLDPRIEKRRWCSRAEK